MLHEMMPLILVSLVLAIIAATVDTGHLLGVSLGITESAVMSYKFRLELFSEEIRADEDAGGSGLRRLVVDGVRQGLAVGEAMSFATPRRLAIVRA